MTGGAWRVARVIHAPHELALPVATSVGGYVLIYVLAPLIVASIIGGAAAFSRLQRRMTIVEQGLAILVQQVSPPGGPALRDLVQGQAVKVATLSGLVAASISPQAAAHIEGND